MPAGREKKTNLFEKPPASARQRNGEAQVKVGQPQGSRKTLISDSPSALVTKPSVDGWDCEVIYTEQNDDISNSGGEQRMGLIQNKRVGNLFEGKANLKHLLCSPSCQTPNLPPALQYSELGKKWTIVSPTFLHSRKGTEIQPYHSMCPR